ncbi:unnamed protein product [Effrenium voratum]|nr:unnamed protein product [Effrenium voratum]
MTSSIDSRPPFAWPQVCPAASLFGDVELLRSLPSERDLNFLVRFTESQELAVFKVHNPQDERAFLECQCKALDHVAQKGALCQRQLRSLDTAEVLVPLKADASEPGHARHFCRALTFLPGEIFADVANKADADELTQLFAKVGQAVGRVTGALRDFEHAAAHREHFVWDLQRCSQVVQDHIGEVEDQRQPLLNRVFKRQMTELDSLLPRLRRSIVHNDPNDYNLVLNEGQVGVLDFGDMLYSFTCADAAIGMAYMLLHIPETMPLVAGILEFVKAFHRECPLEEAELEALFPLALCRACTSLCMSAHQSRLEPDNKYLLISAEPAWRLLERVDAENVQHAKDMFKAECSGITLQVPCRDG